MSSTKIMKQKVASAKKSVLPGSGRRAKVVTDAQKWLTRIDRAKKVRNEWKTKFRVALAYEYLEGQVKPLGVPDNDWICINMIFSILRSLLPTYYQTDPYFYIKLKRSFKPNPMMIALYEMKADGRQSLLNYLKGELNLKQKMRLAIFDALFQYGVVKTHAAADLVENTSKGEPLEDDEGNTLYDPDTNQPIMQPEMLPANEAYSITRVHPDDLLVDEDAGPLEEDIQWIAQRIRRRVDEVRDDKRYTADVRKTVQPTEITDQDEKAKEYRKKGKALSDSEEPAGDVVVTWEIYDLKKKEWLTVAEGCDEFLTDPDDIPKGIERHPFSFLRFFLRDASWYPIPPVTQWLDQQREYSDARSKLMVHRKRFNRKYEAYTPAFDDAPTALTKLETGSDGTVILVNEQAQMGAAIRPIQDAPLDQTNILEINMIRKDFEDLALGPNQRGSSQGVDSATEAGIIEKRSMIQEGDDIALIVDFITEIARKLDQEIQVHMTEDQAIHTEGPDGQAAWRLIRMTDYDEIEGEYEYSVNVGQMRPQLPEIERAQFIQLMTQFATAPQFGTDRNFVRYVAKMFNVEDDRVIDAIVKVCTQIVSGQMGAPQKQGSAPGSPPLPQSTQGGPSGINNIRGGQQ